MKKFNQWFSFLGGISILLMSLTTSSFAVDSLPVANQFLNGQTADANQVNDNFNNAYNKINELVDKVNELDNTVNELTQKVAELEAIINPPIPPDYVARFTFDNADLSDEKNYLTATNSDNVAFVNDDDRGAVTQFSGQSFTVTTGSFNMSAPYTISFWVKPTATNHKYLIGGDNDQELMIAANSNSQFNLYVGSGSDWTYNQWGTTGFISGGWQSIMLVRDSSGNIKFYLDGDPVITTGNTGHTINTLYFGAQGGISSNKFHGKMDDIVFYNRVLDECEIDKVSGKSCS